MDEQERVDRLAAAIDSLVLEGGVASSDPDIAPLLSLATELQDAMPPVQAGPAFQSSLRARLLTPRLPWWKRLLGRAPSGSRALTPSLPRYAFAIAALVLAVGIAALVARSSSDRTQPLQALPAPTTATSIPAASAVAAVPVQPSTAVSVVTAPTAAFSAPTLADAGPLLPPLSESRPVVVLGGLGGGGLGGAEGEVPKREVRFELATSLPALPAEATIYRYKAPSADVERLRKLATSLGFDPAAIRPMADAPDAFVLSDPKLGNMELLGPGAPLSYRADIGKQTPSDISPALPSAEDAARIATTWLAEHDLLPAGMGSPELSRPYDKAPFEEITFRPAEPSNIVGQFPGVTLGVDGTGRIATMTFLWPEVDSALAVPARTADSAWQMLVSGRGQLNFEGEHGRPDFQGTVRITTAETGYRMTFALDGRSYLQPVVIFRGESIMDGDSERHPFEAEVPEAADSALAKEGVRFVLVGDLPRLPAEAHALERVAAPLVTEEQVRGLGRKLGLSGEPRRASGPEMPGSVWEMADPASSYVLRVTEDTGARSWAETWSYASTKFAPRSPDQIGQPPSEEAAIRIAEDFLKSHDLYDPGLGAPRVQPAGLGSSVTIVVFPWKVEGIPNYDPGALTVMLDFEGQVMRVVSNQHPTRPVRTDKLLSPAEAVEAVQAGKGAIQVPSLLGRTIYSDRAEIERVELVYQIRPPEIGNQPPVPDQAPVMRYEPYYLFTGTIEVGESHKRLPFTTTLLAWKFDS